MLTPVARVVTLLLSFVFGVLAAVGPVALPGQGHDEPRVDRSEPASSSTASSEAPHDEARFHCQPVSPDQLAVIGRRASHSPWSEFTPSAVWFELVEAETVVEEPTTQPQLEIVVVPLQAPASPRGPPIFA